MATDERPEGQGTLPPGLIPLSVGKGCVIIADKRRCVEIALREFPKLSSRTIAKMCGVDHEVVDRIRPPQLAETATSRTGSDGKQYHARRGTADPLTHAEYRRGIVRGKAWRRQRALTERVAQTPAISPPQTGSGKAT